MKPIEKTYSPAPVDKKWYLFWEKGKFFSPNPKAKKSPYSLLMPPPNVTGVLHMGHALGSTLDDILIRWKRMLGHQTLWIPGTDHAGIATQTVVEKHLLKTEGKRRTDYTRKEFLKHVWSWKESSEQVIIGQLKRLGISCDWSHLRFTMDPGSNRAVRTAFKRLFDRGLIYKGDYLVNWDPETQTALSDDEVEYEENRSSLWYLSYPIEGTSHSLTVATTRPETMLGDTAVAVHPNDARYQPFVGKFVRHPITSRLIPILADSFVDPEFGTGAVKITPGHDPNDHQMGLRHSLPMINLMTPDGHVNENGLQFAGLSFEDARVQVVKTLRSLGHFVKTEPHTHRVGRSYRSKAIVQPYLSKQWFVRMEPFKGRLRELVQEDIVKLIPPNWQNTYFHWIDNLRDWCVSRQLWWGHQIPIWYRIGDESTVICYDGEGLPAEVAAAPDEWVQDSDVLDTWFSSALWPLTTLGWPDQTGNLQRFYPNSSLITGHDILFFWVARMLLMGDVLFEKPPFPEVYLHSLVFGKSYWKETERGISYITGKEQEKYDMHPSLIPKDICSKWEKMSKSKGNVIDPIEMIDLYGADAVRMALAASASQSWEVDLDRRRFEEFKNFANKVWNGARFILLNTQNLHTDFLANGLAEKLFALEDKWILSSLQRTIEQVNGHLENYQFDAATTAAYNFYWNEFCSYYLEITKPFLLGKKGTEKEKQHKQRVLICVLTHALALMHPMAPFITEELFQLVRSQFTTSKEPVHAHPILDQTIRMLASPSIMVAPYPLSIPLDKEALLVHKQFDFIGGLIYSVRNIRGEMSLAPSESVDLYLVPQDKNSENVIRQNEHVLYSLVKIEQIHIGKLPEETLFCSKAVTDGVQILIPLPKHLLSRERNRLQKERTKLTSYIAQIQSKLGNKNFVEKAPKKLVTQQKSELQKSLQRMEEIDKIL